MSVTLLVADTVWSNIESTGSVTEEQLSILHLLFGKNLEKATRIIDKRGVKKISGLPSGRSIFQVVGESQKREEYLCFPGDYCGCYSFFYDVVSRGEQQCMLMSTLYTATEFNFIPTGGFRIVTVFEFSAIAMILILRLVGVYRRRRLAQRVRHVAAAELEPE